MATKRAKIIGRLIAAGQLDANAPVTWGALAHVNDLAEGTSHGKGRRAELESTDINTGARIGDDEHCKYETVSEFEKKTGQTFDPVLPSLKPLAGAAATSAAKKGKK